MTSKLTRERLQEIAEDGFLKHGESKELARMALVAMDSEPVKRVNADQMHHVCLEANRHLDKYGAMAKEVNKLLGRIPAQPAPVVQDGYVMVPMRLTAENGAKGALSGEFSETKFVNCPECFGDDECETCDGSGRIEITVPVTWTTIKEIWAKGVEHFSATPRAVKGE
ncbi:TPA: hypothetical protein RMR72_000883 [Klebsiella pneumoniae]|uniref:hypothetical protein n=1 Tax=Klebsiella pneumoniae TaxID=573 RepID=UPI00132FC8A1|nr:hypothetical protein [Klebsiella pneumoniae]GKM60580.1 hypothetical protein MS5214_07750 [Klebsiella pneumoniae]HCI7956090.1 hypothetical protein [Klebsiella pneumoniae]HDW3825683.1 hypothetical protein [Klebsiella pneumoniae]